MRAHWAVTATISLLIGGAAFGQLVEPVTFRPALPTDRDPITARIVALFGACNVEVATVVTSNVIRTTLNFDFCESVPAFEFFAGAVFGPLPAGTYTYEVYYDDTSDSEGPILLSSQALVVSAAPAIPTLGSGAVLALTVLLAGISIVLLRRGAA